MTHCFLCPSFNRPHRLEVLHLLYPCSVYGASVPLHDLDGLLLRGGVGAVLWGSPSLFPFSLVVTMLSPSSSPSPLLLPPRHHPEGANSLTCFPSVVLEDQFAPLEKVKLNFFVFL